MRPPGLNGTLGVHFERIQLGANVPPPGLRVAYEIDFGMSPQHRFEALESRVVCHVLEMYQHRDPDLRRQRVNPKHLGRVH